MMGRDTAHHSRALRVGAHWLAAVAICALAACETSSTTDEAPLAPEPASSPERPGVVMPAAPPGPQSSSEQADPGSAAPAPALAARPEPAEPTVDSNPERLLGLDRGGLTDLLGSPAFVRDDAPAQLWRYRNETCLLDLFLYTDNDPYRKRLTVKHYEARGAGDNKIEAEACLKNLLLARITKPVG